MFGACLGPERLKPVGTSARRGGCPYGAAGRFLAIDCLAIYRGAGRGCSRSGMLLRRIPGGGRGLSTRSSLATIPMPCPRMERDVWVTNLSEGTVSEIEASSGTVIRTIAVGESPISVSSDGSHVWVLNGGPENTVSEIEASSGTVIRTIPVGSDAYGLSSDGTDVWVTHPPTELVTEIEASSGTVIRRSRSTAGHMASPRTEHMCGSANPEEDTATELEVASGTVLRTIPVGREPEGVSADGTHVWVANYAEAPEGTVSEIEASTGTVIRTIPAGRGANQVSSDGTMSGSRPTLTTRSPRSKRRLAPSSTRSTSAMNLMACHRTVRTSGSRTTANIQSVRFCRTRLALDATPTKRRSGFHRVSQTHQQSRR